jgi:sarcosine oxidase subunit gamma
VAPNTWTKGAQSVYWLGPDEWLVVAAAASGLYKRLAAALENCPSALNCLSGGLVQMRLSGSASTTVLAKGCTIDLHPASFRTGRCAQTLLAKASVLIALTDERPDFNLIVRRSFAEYIALWLENAGDEFGIEFQIDD